MSRPATSLTRKFAFGTAAGLLASSLVFLILFVGLFRGQLEHQRADAAGQVSGLLQISLESAMLRRDLEGLRGIVERLGQEPNVVAVAIANPQGEIRFADDSARIGQHLPIDHREQPTTLLIQKEDGATVLRSIHPVHNQSRCLECHGPVAEHPINGVLYVDFDADSISHQARKTTLLLMGAGSIIVLLNLAGGWWFMRRYVLRPVAHLANASARLSEGDLGTRTSLTGKDELTALGETMNRMAEALERKMTELREKEQFLQQLLDAFPDGVRVIDQDYRVLLCNTAYRRQIGPIEPPTEERPQGPDPTGLPCFMQTHGQDQPCPETLMTCPLREVTRTQEPLRLVHRLQRPDGEGLDVETYAAALTIAKGSETQHLVVESIRDLGQALRFSHEQRLSELGRLAAGVAHEIHNPLGSVRLALHAAVGAAHAEPPDRAAIIDCLDIVDQEVDSCIQVTHRLLRLSVPVPEHLELVDIGEAVDDTLRLLTWEAQERGVMLRQELDRVPLRVLATDTELRMAMLNLAQNALHAMPNGGTLTVTCAKRGRFVAIDFTDTGIGIPREDQDRIFQPFFSRRADGVEGTGLGLSITKAFVEGYGGSVKVISEHERGSCFTLQLPDADLGPGPDDGAEPNHLTPREH